jgi:hypothetical protein
MGEDTVDIATSTTTDEMFQRCLNSVGGLLYCCQYLNYWHGTVVEYGARLTSLASNPFVS